MKWLFVDQSGRQHRKVYGYVDTGAGANKGTVAKDIFVVLNCINGKILVGYLLIDGINGD